MEKRILWSDLIKLYNEYHLDGELLTRLAFLDNSSGFEAFTYKIIFKLLEKQIPVFGEISPTFLSKSVICFQEK